MSIAHWLMLLVTLLVAIALATSFGGFLVLAVERGQPVKMSVASVATYIRDALARVLFLVLEPWGRRDRGPTRANVDVHIDAPPVLLVPTVGWSTTTLSFLRTFLVQRGWSVVWAMNHARGDFSLASRAEVLEEKVKELCRFAGTDKVDLVCHGVGGLVAAWFIRHRDGGRLVRRLVTIATPWQGTRLAVFLRGEFAAEVQYGAHQLDALLPVSVPTIAIWSPDDSFVVPSESAHGLSMDNVSIDGAGHMDLAVSARAFRAVQAALTHPIGDIA